MWALRYEMAIRLEDVLARRTRSLFLGAEDSKESAPIVAKIMAEELGHDEHWIRQQLIQYATLADGYRIQKEL